jgi:hypothetical protein
LESATVDIDLRKRLQDEANKIVNKAKYISKINDPELNQLLKGIVFMGLKQGYIWGINSVMQVSKMCLDDLNGTQIKSQLEKND